MYTNTCTHMQSREVATYLVSSLHFSFSSRFLSFLFPSFLYTLSNTLPLSPYHPLSTFPQRLYPGYFFSSFATLNLFYHSKIGPRTLSSFRFPTIFPSRSLPLSLFAGRRTKTRNAVRRLFPIDDSSIPSSIPT